MLVVSELPEFKVTLYPIEEWPISCCPCSAPRQHNDSVVVDSDLPKTLAKRGIRLHASASLILYGSLMPQKEARSVGPAVFFHSPVPLESHAIHLRVPVDGVKVCHNNCTVLPSIGTYDGYSYMFQSRESQALIHKDRNSNSSQLIVAVKDTVIFRPSCISGPFPCCPTFEYEVRLYRSRATESARKHSLVVFIKSKLWKAVSITCNCAYTLQPVVGTLHVLLHTAQLHCSICQVLYAQMLCRMYICVFSQMPLV